MSQPTPPAASEPVLDPATLERLVQDVGDASTVGAVADVYLEQLPLRLAELRATVHTDANGCRRVAHSLKSASATLGLAALADRCLRLELALEAEPDRAVRADGLLVEELLAAVEQAAGPAGEHLAAWRRGA